MGDQEFRIKSNAAIKNLIQSNRTVILASHNLVTLRELCGRVVWIENGRVQAVAETEEVLEQYTQ